MLTDFCRPENAFYRHEKAGLVGRYYHFRESTKRPPNARKNFAFLAHVDPQSHAPNSDVRATIKSAQTMLENASMASFGWVLDLVLGVEGCRGV